MLGHAHVSHDEFDVFDMDMVGGFGGDISEAIHGLRCHHCEVYERCCLVLNKKNGKISSEDSDAKGTMNLQICPAYGVNAILESW